MQIQLLVLSVLSLVLLYSAFITGKEKRKHMIEFAYINVTNYDKNFFKDIHYEINHGASLEFTLLRSIRYLGLRVRFDMLRKDNTKINVMNINNDGCKILDASLTNNLLRSTIQEFRRVSNFPKKCPLEAKMYYIKNYTVNIEAYPLRVPSMNWIMTFEGRHNDIPIIEIYLKGKVLQL